VAGTVARGDVRLYQFAAPDKKRPVLVLTRDSAIAYLSTVTVAPVTSTIRGVPSEVILNEVDGMKAPCAVNLHNAVTISQNRLGRRVCATEFLADAGSLRGFALFPRVRPQSILAEATAINPSQDHCPFKIRGSLPWSSWPVLSAPSIQYTACWLISCS
jgi:mRNA interferase MazF